MFDRLARRGVAQGVVLGHHPRPARAARDRERARATSLTSDEEVPVPPARSDPGTDSAVAAWRAVPLHLAAMPGGALVGTVVHSVFEHTEFDAPDLVAAGRHRAGPRGRHGAASTSATADAVVAGLCAAIESPLGPMVGGIRLADVARRDRLDELGFELPLVGGDDASGTAHVAQVADVLEAHLPAGDPVARYAAALRDPALNGVLRGYLTGSLDLVLRLPDGRFVIADYKTNRLGGAGRDAHRVALPPRRAGRRDAGGPLPAPGAALRGGPAPLPALAPAGLRPGTPPRRRPLSLRPRHERGRSRRATGTTPGVWSWQPPTSVVEALSDLFDTGGGA